MSATARALRLVRRLEEDDAWTLLRADNAPFAIALLAEHLGGGEHRVDADQLAEAIDTDLEEIRSYGHDMPLSARGYLTSWRTAGLIHRRPSEVSRGETYELTVDALAAIRFLQTREEPQEAATASRLASLSMQLTRLAIDTDPESARRLERLRAERDRIDAQIQAVLDGEEEVLGGARALERLRELLAQAAEVPDDFTRVRGVFEELSSTLRAKVLESDASQRSVLDDVFRGVDHIGDSDAGRSFAAFSALVLDPALGAAFERDIADVLDREFARDLAPAQRRRLRGFLDDLKDRTAEVHDVITVFARGLRRYVQSQDYQRDRVLRGKLLAAMGAAHRAAPDIKPYAAIGLNLELTGVPVSSVGAITLHDPSEFDTRAEVVTHISHEVDIEMLRALARETEIDFTELASNVNEVLQANEHPTVGDVLAAFPATQGVASVVGLLSLAAEHGAMEDGVEQISWTSADDVRSTALVTTHRFTGRIP
ncbi:MAG: hypothetical protein BGN97_05280 [Microbacterium sp. 69-10]|uniref:DUF3375 domain-containing protein n=1 Tax=Microbacterium sp. 69-10 TaxID=1895783 RepID=UPI0009661325|nr:DUF3375 domain-containing protein [Microbacterium sp. 69-10]OJU40721.1 MAG: hypothetical protein BGN97_05280 [Microbacterium sp. 69-10]